MKEFVDACRKHGLKVGLYYSPPDWGFDREVSRFGYAGKARPWTWITNGHAPAQASRSRRAAAADLVRGQVPELLTNYGKIDLIWFDGGKGEIPNEEVRRLQPGIVVNSATAGGAITATARSLARHPFPGWFETCATCWPSKEMVLPEDYGSTTRRMALTKLVLLRAWGGNLLANVGPKGDGSVPEHALACWKDMAEWMTHSRESVIGTQPGPWPRDATCRSPRQRMPPTFTSCRISRQKRKKSYVHCLATRMNSFGKPRASHPKRSCSAPAQKSRSNMITARCASSSSPS